MFITHVNLEEREIRNFSCAGHRLGPLDRAVGVEFASVEFAGVEFGRKIRLCWTPLI